MKSQKIISLLGLVIVMLAAGCGNPAMSSGGTSTLPARTATLTFTLTPIPTPFPSPTTTPTAAPILTTEDARKRLLDLLADNGGCRLPCLLGITPGKNTNLEAQNSLLPLSSISISTQLSGDSPDGIWLIYHENELQTSIELDYLFGSNGVISRIVFQAGEFKELAGNRSLVYDSKIFGERLRPYMLSGILSEFGKPASVIIHTYGEQITGSGGFEILIFYPDEGIFVHYTTQMETVGVYAQGCPVNAQVELELYPSGDADAFAKSLAETDWAFAWPKLIENPSWKSIEDATSMTLEQFYEAFRNPTDECIQTPINFWPTPEPPAEH